MSIIRDRIVEEAYKVVGLCACPPWRAEFSDVLGKVKGGWWLNVPFHCWQVPPTGKWKTEGVSGCALVGFRGILHRAGVKTDAELNYVHGTVFIIADKYLKPALVEGEALRWITPDIGDAIVVGKGIGTHWSTAVRWEGPADAPILVTVDGGNTCQHGCEDGHVGLVNRPWGAGRLQAIKLCKRPWTYTPQGLPKLGDRIVQKWYNADLMPLKHT